MQLQWIRQMKIGQKIDKKSGSASFELLRLCIMYHLLHSDDQEVPKAHLQFSPLFLSAWVSA
jgi:hypothetical protein